MPLKDWLNVTRKASWSSALSGMICRVGSAFWKTGPVESEGKALWPLPVHTPPPHLSRSQTECLPLWASSGHVCPVWPMGCLFTLLSAQSHLYAFAYSLFQKLPKFLVTPPGLYSWHLMKKTNKKLKLAKDAPVNPRKGLNLLENQCPGKVSHFTGIVLSGSFLQHSFNARRVYHRIWMESLTQEFSQVLLNRRTALLGLPGGPVVRTLCSQCRGHRFDTCSRN